MWASPLSCCLASSPHHQLSDVAKGLGYLWCNSWESQGRTWSRPIIVLTPTPQNIPVDSTGRAQITAISPATGTQSLVSVHTIPTYYKNHIQWAAPGILHVPGACSKEGDVFSFAGVMIEVCSGWPIRCCHMSKRSREIRIMGLRIVLGATLLWV